MKILDTLIRLVTPSYNKTYIVNDLNKYTLIKWRDKKYLEDQIAKVLTEQSLIARPFRNHYTKVYEVFPTLDQSEFFDLYIERGYLIKKAD